MSSIDPSIIAAAQAFVRSADAALADAALNLGAEADAIVAQLHVGDLLPALVLPAQNGADRLEIFGQPVAAQLPPGIHPGETIVLQVTAFEGSKILVTNLGVADPEHPPALVQIEVPDVPPGAPVAATLTRIPSPAPAAPAAPAAAPPSAGPAPPAAAVPPVAPPHAVFVAASVRPAAPAAEPPEISAGRVPVAPESEIEARIGASRTSASRVPPQAEAARPPARLPLTPRPVPFVPARRAAAQAAPAAARATATRATTAQPVDEAGRLLARLRVPATPLTLAAARIVREAAAAVPRAFSRLEASLPKELPAAAAPLRALLAFVGKIEPANARALPEQIAAFVAHVVDGPEPKIAQAVAGHRQADAETASPEGRQPAPDARPGAVERSVAAAFDLKTALSALADSPEVRASPQLAQAVADALTATTAAQLGALAARADDPSTFAIALPAFYHPGGRPVQLAIARDAPGGGRALDPDNFRIGFVLDTKALGTLAIDVETVGRSVRVDVKTERRLVADRIEASLPDLRARFEHLRYRVAAMSAGVAPAAAVAPAGSAPPEETAPASGLDLRA